MIQVGLPSVIMKICLFGFFLLTQQVHRQFQSGYCIGMVWPHLEIKADLLFRWARHRFQKPEYPSIFRITGRDHLAETMPTFFAGVMRSSPYKIIE